MEIQTFDTVYEPAEDSYLLLRAISGQPMRNKRVLDMGTGTGIIGIACALEGADVTCVDVNPKAIENALFNAKKNNAPIDARAGDLFAPVGRRVFDVVIFNAPYLPGTPKNMEDRALVGGRGGREVIDRFLMRVSKHVEKSGVVFLVQSSFSDVEKTLKKAGVLGYFASVVGKEHYFFEDIVVIRMVLKKNAPGSINHERAGKKLCPGK